MTAPIATGPKGYGAVTAAMLSATYMQAANISLPNAALLHIQGTLSMADDQAGWIFTSYIVGSAITMPTTRWFAGRYGRKIVYQLSIVVFVLGLMLAPSAGTSMQFVGARIVQGAASGPLAPLSLAILLDLLPHERHGFINRIWTVTLVSGIVSGPSIGGWLAEHHGWRSIFYLSVPVAGFVLVAVTLLVSEKRAEQSPHFDLFGFATLTLGLVGLQMSLDRGERLEWFASCEIWLEAAGSALGFYLFAVHILTTDKHFVKKAILTDRNFVISSAMIFAFGFVLLPTMALTSPMLDELLKYPADTTGYVAIPRSVALVATLILVGFIPARVDNRLLLAGGSALVVYANWRMLGYSPSMHWRTVVEAGVLQGAGLGILMPVLTRTALSTLRPEFHPEGNVLINLSRLYGSTIGVAVVQTYFYYNTQSMHLALAKNLSPYRVLPLGETGLTRQSLMALNGLVTEQAAFVALVGQFKLLMVVMLIVSPLLLFLRRPGATGRRSRTPP